MTAPAVLSQKNIQNKLGKEKRCRNIAILLFSIFFLLLSISFESEFIFSILGIYSIGSVGFSLILITFSFLFLLGSLYKLFLSKHFSLTTNEHILNLAIKAVNELELILESPEKNSRSNAVKTIKKITSTALNPLCSNSLKFDEILQLEAQLLTFGMNTKKFINILQTGETIRIQQALKLLKDIRIVFSSSVLSKTDLEKLNIILDSFPEPRDYTETNKFQAVISLFQHTRYLGDVCYFLFVIIVCYFSFTITVNWLSIPVGNAYAAVITLFTFFSGLYISQKFKNKSSES